MDGSKPDLEVILGDFNIYNEWAWPINYLTDGEVTQSNQCTHVLNRHHPNKEGEPPPWYTNPSIRTEQFSDSWKTRHPQSDGFTFSTLGGERGLHVRPDRILFRAESPVRLSHVSLHEENGCTSRWCFWRTVRQRASKVLSLFSRDPMISCDHDCGNNATCHCGVCVHNPPSNDVALPTCPHFHFDAFLIVSLAALCLFLALLSSSLLYCIFRGGHDSSFYHSKWRRVGLSASFVSLLFVWGALAFLFASSFSPMVRSFLEIVVDRVTPNELQTSDHVLVSAEFQIY